MTTSVPSNSSSQTVNQSPSSTPSPLKKSFLLPLNTGKPTPSANVQKNSKKFSPQQTTLGTIARLCRGLLILLPTAAVGASMLAFSLASKITLAVLVCACTIAITAGAVGGALLGTLAFLTLPIIAQIFINPIEIMGGSLLAGGAAVELCLTTPCLLIATGVELPHYVSMCLFWPLAQTLADDWNLFKPETRAKMEAPNFTYIGSENNTESTSSGATHYSYYQAIEPSLPLFSIYHEWRKPNDSLESLANNLYRAFIDPYTVPQDRLTVWNRV